MDNKLSQFRANIGLGSIQNIESCRTFLSDRDTVFVQDSGGPMERPITYSVPLRTNTVLCLFNTSCMYVCVGVCVCTVTDFYTEDKASGVKFCTAVYRRPRQGITHFCELCFPKSPTSDESASARATPTRM